MRPLERPPRIWPVLLASALGIAILVTLGFWQVDRLKWKEELLAQLGANAAAEPIGLAEVETLQAEGRSVEFVKVRFKGTYKNDAWMKMISTFEGGQGWIILTPAVTADGRSVIVDRGRIPGQLLDGFDKPEGEQEITGVVRAYSRGQGYFDPANDPKANLWYWWDIPGMLAASNLPETLKPVPFVVQVLPGTVAAEFPKPPEPKANLANNHLGYAITWFGLALTLAAVAVAYLLDQRKRRRA
jgi:surfeit locus 1 family protein